MTTTIVTDHDKREWSRMAQDAYRQDRNFYGHRYSAAASLPTNERMRVDVLDTLQRVYRLWLIGGWAAVDNGSL